MEVLDSGPPRGVGDYASRLGIQGRQRRQINVRRPDTEEREQAGTAGSTSQRSDGSGASNAPKFTPLIYVPEKQRMAESGASAGNQYSGRATGGATDSYHGRHWTAGSSKPESTESVLNTTRGLFKMRPRRNIRVKSIDEVEDDRPPERPSSAGSMTGSNETSYSTGFIREPTSGNSSLARRDRHTVSDLLGARKAASIAPPQPPYQPALPPPHLLPEPPLYSHLPLGGEPQSELHVLQPIADLYAKYQNNGFHPLEARHPPIGSESGIVPMEEVPPPPRPLMFSDNKPFFLDDELPESQDIGQEEPEMCPGMLLEGVNQTIVDGQNPEQLVGINETMNDPGFTQQHHPPPDQLSVAPIPFSGPPAEVRPPVESYEERIAALKARMRESSLVPSADVAPREETLDERKERILGNLYKQKYGEPVVDTTPPRYETLEQKREKIMANLRRKHSANLQAQDLLGLMDGRTQSPVTFSRSMSLGDPLRDDPLSADWLPHREEPLPSRDWLPHRQEPQNWQPHQQEPQNWLPHRDEHVHVPTSDWLPRHEEQTHPASRLPPGDEIGAQCASEEQPKVSGQTVPQDMEQSELVPQSVSEGKATESNSPAEISERLDPEPEVPLFGSCESSASRDLSPSREDRTSVFVKLRPTQSNASREIRESSNSRSGSFQIRAGTGAKSFLDRSEISKNVGQSRSQGGSPNDEVMSVDSGFHDKVSSEPKPEPQASKTPLEYDSSKRRGSTSSSASGSSKADSVVPKSPGPGRRNYLKPWAQGTTSDTSKANATNTLPKKKTGPPTKPKPQASSQPQPRSKSTPPSKSKSTTNLAEVGLTQPRRERSSSMAKESDYQESSGTPFSRNSRLRSSTKAWEQRQAEKQNETKKSTAKSNPPPKVPPKPAAPKKAQPGIVGKVTLSEDAAQDSKGIHTPRNSSTYDKPWRTGSSLGRGGSSSQGSPQPGGSASSRTQSPSSGRPRRISVSASSSRSHSPSASRSRRGSMDLLNDTPRPPKNPVKGQGSVETEGGPRSPKSRNNPRPGNNGANSTGKQPENLKAEKPHKGPDNLQAKKQLSGPAKLKTNRLSDDEYKSLLDLAADWLFGEEQAANEVTNSLESGKGEERKFKDLEETLSGENRDVGNESVKESAKEECFGVSAQNNPSCGQDTQQSALDTDNVRDTTPCVDDATKTEDKKITPQDISPSTTKSKASHSENISKYSVYACSRSFQPLYGRLIAVRA